MKDKILAKENSIEVYRNFLKILFFKTGCPVLNTAIEADDTHKGLLEKTTVALAFWKKSIENQIKRGIERKEIKADTNPSQVAVII